MALRDSNFDPIAGAPVQIISATQAVPADATVIGNAPAAAAGRIKEAGITVLDETGLTSHGVTPQKIDSSLAAPMATDAPAHVLQAAGPILYTAASAVPGVNVTAAIQVEGPRYGAAAAGGASTITLPAVADFPAISGYFSGASIKIISGTGAGQTRKVISYSTARVATVDVAWTVVPDTTSVFEIKPRGAIVRAGDQFQFVFDVTTVGTSVRTIGWVKILLDERAQ